jgi:hypothetical protein
MLSGYVGSGYEVVSTPNTFTTTGLINWGFADSAQNPSSAPQDGNPAFVPTTSSSYPISVYVVNQTSSTWGTSGGDVDDQVSYRVLSASGGAVVVAQGPATPFSPAVAPGSGAWITVNVGPTLAALTPGSYIVEFDMLTSGGQWMSSYGQPTADFRVLVTPPPGSTSLSSSVQAGGGRSRPASAPTPARAARSTSSR